MVPIGEQAIVVARAVPERRAPGVVVPPDDGVLFLTAAAKSLPRIA